MASDGEVKGLSWQHSTRSQIRADRANMADAVTGTPDQVGGKGVKPCFLPQVRNVLALVNN